MWIIGGVEVSVLVVMRVYALYGVSVRRVRVGIVGDGVLGDA